MVGRVLEISFTLILVYLVLINRKGFSQGVNAISSAYIGAVKALQGRN